MQRDSTPRNHIKRLLPMIDALLKEQALQLKDLDALAFNCGPGSFTGLRIGIGVIQGLAMGSDLPVVPVSTLHALAQRAIDEIGVAEDSSIMPVIDARMDEVYWGLYQNRSGLAHSLMEDSLSAPEDIKDIYYSIPARAEMGVQDAELKSRPHIAVGLGDGWGMGERIALEPDTIDAQVTTDAEQTLRLAQVAYERGEARHIDDVELRYLRNKTTWKKRRKLRA